MKTTAINSMEKDFSLARSQDNAQYFKRCKDHLLQDVIPTLLILAIVAGGALMGARSIHQAKTAHQITLIDNR